MESVRRHEDQKLTNFAYCLIQHHAHRCINKIDSKLPQLYRDILRNHYLSTRRRNRELSDLVRWFEEQKAAQIGQRFDGQQFTDHSSNVRTDDDTSEATSLDIEKQMKRHSARLEIAERKRNLRENTKRQAEAAEYYELKKAAHALQELSQQVRNVPNAITEKHRHIISLPQPIPKRSRTRYQYEIRARP